MTPLRLSILLLATLLPACSSSSGTSPNNLLSAVQDLTLDPSGQTTLLTFARNLPATVTPGHFTADGGQLATSVSVNGAEVSVTWDERVTPTHQVRPQGLGSLSSALVAVTTTDPAAPTFSITAATQVPGLGGDTITAQFSGANVVGNCAETLANWVLSVNGTTLDLTDSVFDLDPATQILSVTLGGMANLHANFELNPTSDVVSVADVALASTPVAGIAAGDMDAPMFVSAEQNLTEDEFGFVVDVTFSEAMDPVFSLNPSSFGVGFPAFATSVTQPTEGVLRVTFNAPVIPGHDTIDLAGLLDAHGNVLPDAPATAVGSTPVVNAFDTDPVLDTVANAGGDTITAVFTQAIDPESAEDFSIWDLESPLGNAIDLSNSTFSYDFFAKTLTVTLDTDLVTGDTFSFGAGAPGPFPLDVDGEDFTTVFNTGTVTGDASATTVLSVVQNRQVDDTGLTYDVNLSEDVDSVEAETLANYTFTGGITVTSANLLAGMDVVRLEVDLLALPGQETVDVENLVDLAGNAMGLQAGVAITTSDTVAPQASGATAFAESGLENDTLTVVFDDRMVPAEVTDPLNWIFESPVGAMVDTTMASVTYQASTGVATLVFDGGDGIHLKRWDDFSLDFQNLTDVSGNSLGSTAQVGVVDAESAAPELESVWVETLASNKIHVRFDEPVDELDDALTSYVIRDAMLDDIGGGTPTVVVDADQLGATLTFATGADPALHTLEIRGVTDTAGNQMFPVLAVPVRAQDSAAPVLEAAAQVHLALSGENNDQLTAVFDRQVSTWGLFDEANWDVTNGVDSADFSSAEFSFDGDRTVTVTFAGPDGYNFDASADTLTVDNLLSAQGVPMAGASVDMTAADAGSDVTAPVFGLNGVRIDPQDPSNSILIEMDEALDTSEATNTASFSHDVLGNPDSAILLGPRTVRASWIAGGLAPGVVVDVTAPDLAQNAGLAMLAIQAADTTGPVPDHVEGRIGAGVGGDAIAVRFNEPVSTLTAFQHANYSVTVDGEALDISGAVFRYDSSTNTVNIGLPDEVNLDAMSAITVDVNGIANHSGLTFPGSRNGFVVGDVVAPDFAEAFVNYRRNAGGTVIDLRFSEDMDALTAGLPASYTASGGQLVLAAEMIADDSVRLTLSAPLLAAETIDADGLPDLAGNASGTIFVAPIQ